MAEMIRMFMRDGEAYLNRDDIMRLIEKACKKADTLNAKETLKALAKSLDYGQLDTTEIHKKKGN